MILNDEYIRISDLFEDTLKRANQLASLAMVLQDAIAFPDSSPKALYDTAWLLSDLLREQHRAITELQDEHRKDFLSRQGKWL